MGPLSSTPSSKDVSPRFPSLTSLILLLCSPIRFSSSCMLGPFSTPYLLILSRTHPFIKTRITNVPTYDRPADIPGETVVADVKGGLCLHRGGRGRGSTAQEAGNVQHLQKYMLKSRLNLLSILYRN